MAEQHAVGGGERQRVGGGLLPGQVLGPVHQLPVLHAAELGEGAVRRLVPPDALRGREHRVAAVAFLVVAVVLVAVDDDLVADLPALDLGADRPDDARGVGAGDVIGILVHVERRDRLAERRPDAVVVDARRHHENEHVVAVELPGRHDLDLHRLFRRPVPLLADGPGVHRLRHMAERGNFADLVEILDRSVGRQVLLGRASVHGLPQMRRLGDRKQTGRPRILRRTIQHCALKAENQSSFGQAQGASARRIDRRPGCDQLPRSAGRPGRNEDCGVGWLFLRLCCAQNPGSARDALPMRCGGRAPTKRARREPALKVSRWRRRTGKRWRSGTNPGSSAPTPATRRRASRTGFTARISPRARRASPSPSICRPRPAMTATTSWRAARSARSASRFPTSATCARCSRRSRSPR